MLHHAFSEDRPRVNKYVVLTFICVACYRSSRFQALSSWDYNHTHKHASNFPVRWGQVDYKAPLPCLTTALVNITIDRVEGRKRFISARLQSLDEVVLFASADALLIKQKPNKNATSSS